MRQCTSFRTLLLTAGMLSMSACFASLVPRHGVVYARRAPAPRVYEAVGNSPGTDHVCIPRHQARRGEHDVWVSGRYAQPARGFRQYESGRWVHDRAG